MGAAVGAGVAGVVGATVVSTGMGAGLVVPGTELLVVVVTSVVDDELGTVSVATLSSPPVEVITQMITPMRNTNTTPITAGMFTFQRSFGAGGGTGGCPYGAFAIPPVCHPHPHQTPRPAPSANA